MNFTDIFVRRPVLATVLSLLILLLGLRSIGLLELREYPRTERAVVTVTTAYPGADADLVQSFITAPLQRAIAEANGLDYVQGNSRQGVSIIEAVMQLNYDGNVAVAEIQAKVGSQRNQIPTEALDPVIDVRTEQGWSLMYIGFSSDSMRASQITDYLMRGVIPRMQAIPGVAKAEVMGDQQLAMRIWLDPRRMAALNVTAMDVRAALRRENVQAGVGQTQDDLLQVNLSAATDMTNVRQFEQLIVRSDDAALVRLADIADVELNARNLNQVSWYSGEPSTLVGIETGPGANPIEVSRAIRDLLPEVERQLPPNLTMALTHDGSEYIEASIAEVYRTLFEAVAIVLLLIFLALGSARAAIVPAVSVPLSLVGATFVMLTLGFSLNLLTLLAMLLAIGLVVDDAIIVVENVHRHMAAGKGRLEAALSGARELGLPIIAMTTTLLAVYAPIGFMGGLVGIVFTEFAFSLAGAVLISGIVALTFSPMLSAVVLKTSSQQGRFERSVEHFFERLSSAYGRWLHRSLDYRPVTFYASAVILVGIYFMFTTSQTEFAPVEDREAINIQMTAPHTATLEYTEAHTRRLVDLFETIPEYARSFLMLGGGGTPAVTFGGFRLSPIDERERSQMEIQPILQRLVQQVPGVQIGVFSFPALPGAAAGPPVQFVVTGDQDYQELDRVAGQLVGEAMQSGQFLFVNKSSEMALPQIRINVDRDRAGDLGIDMESLGFTLATLLGEGHVSRFSQAGRSYEVIPQVARPFRSSAKSLENYHVRGDDGQLIPLSAVVSFEHRVEPTQRMELQQLNAITINAVPSPGVSLGDALTYFETRAAEIFPRELAYDYLGEARQFRQQGEALVLTFFLSLLVIYLVLAAQFESWRDPLIILMSVPMTIAGALVFVTLGFASINLYTQVGLITLIGLVAKNGILIVDFANRMRDQEGMALREAVEAAAAIRLRPILMTTVAMLVAMVPLLLASGPGAVSRFHIGLVVFTGLGIGTLFTLFVVPAFYVLLAQRQRRAAGTAAAG
ncbi:MAG: efflux RND transporter permease subunit [Gammaproteobacteria bacterium]|nr:efflux RND transporter permease subunit [Gammaproteobacteria bacterium]